MDVHIHAVVYRGEWCGLCYEGFRHRRTYPGHYGFNPRSRKGRVLSMKFLTRPEPEPDRNGAGRMVDGGSWTSGLPALVEFLTEAQWEDGSPRALGSLTLFAGDGLWKCCLTDKDSSRVAFVSAQTPTEVFQAAEKGLREGTLDWRAQKPYRGKGK